MEPIDLSENLSRFLLQRQHWYRTDNPPVKSRVKYAAFMPHPKNGETSVFRTSNITEEEVWNIGEREVSAKRGKPVLGRADILANLVISNDLVINPSEQPERHANIAGWPDEPSKLKLIALELAEEAQLHLKSE